MNFNIESKYVSQGPLSIPNQFGRVIIPNFLMFVPSHITILRISAKRLLDFTMLECLPPHLQILHLSQMDTVSFEFGGDALLDKIFEKTQNNLIALKLSRVSRISKFGNFSSRLQSLELHSYLEIPILEDLFDPLPKSLRSFSLGHCNIIFPERLPSSLEYLTLSFGFKHKLADFSQYILPNGIKILQLINIIGDDVILPKKFKIVNRSPKDIFSKFTSMICIPEQ